MLFAIYDTDQTGSLNYREFADNLFGKSFTGEGTGTKIS